jgi:hypothetical protein
MYRYQDTINGAGKTQLEVKVVSTAIPMWKQLYIALYTHRILSILNMMV